MICLPVTQRLRAVACLLRALDYLVICSQDSWLVGVSLHSMISSHRAMAVYAWWGVSNSEINTCPRLSLNEGQFKTPTYVSEIPAIVNLHYRLSSKLYATPWNTKVAKPNEGHFWRHYSHLVPHV